MAYKGYRLKIEGVVFPNQYMIRGTYSCTPHIKSISDQFQDMNGKNHIYYNPHETMEITFTLRERSLALHEELIQFFRKTKDINIECWDSSACEYITGLFHLDDVKFPEKYSVGDDIYYDNAAIKFTSY